MRLKPITIFYAVVIYAVSQLFWWAALLVELQPTRRGMIIGEGVVFITLMAFGIYKLHEAINREKRITGQQKNFLLSVTHELKSPLASIKLYLQTINKRELDKEQQRSFIAKCLLDIERLDDLVENMLLATKIENKSYSFPKQDLNLSDLVEKIVSRLQIHVCSKESILTSIDPNVFITGDQFAISSVVTNLIENAVKYSPDCVPVHVDLHRNENGTVCFKVADLGMGIPDEEKPKIFDKFYRVGSEETRKTKGTGLGLFIVKQVLDNHRAQIRVKNNQPRGTVFEVSFN
ncbi:two-component sensor histidine kinase [Pelobium manganitolerans]|uniref:histidine kinase n=1 Tax=Pelobium manganitolerans TaxID=1842495 RepID=A0A419S1T9_9SPHI|nr:HAMP domain-containing sensor histidine kinase [Pelobium manganitolerans]RKD12454.1 two-component sensor histidine kinase [Pelobium manganitolerans]